MGSCYPDKCSSQPGANTPQEHAMRAKPRARYGVLDDFGEVIRWQWDKPPSCYKFITERVKRAHEEAPDEPAPF